MNQKETLICAIIDELEKKEIKELYKIYDSLDGDTKRFIGKADGFL